MKPLQKYCCGNSFAFMTSKGVASMGCSPFYFLMIAACRKIWQLAVLNSAEYQLRIQTFQRLLYIIAETGMCFGSLYYGAAGGSEPAEAICHG